MGVGATGPRDYRSCAAMRDYANAMCLDCYSPQRRHQTKPWSSLGAQIRLGYDGNVYSGAGTLVFFEPVY
jgi:hypothetical protein